MAVLRPTFFRLFTKLRSRKWRAARSSGQAPEAAVGGNVFTEVGREDAGMEVQPASLTQPRNILYRAVQCTGGSVRTDSWRWEAPRRPKMKWKLGGLSLTAPISCSCGERNHRQCIEESFRMYHQVLERGDFEVSNSASSRCDEDGSRYYTAPGSSMESSCCGDNMADEAMKAVKDFCPGDAAVPSLMDFEIMTTYSRHPWSDFERSMQEMMTAFRPTELRELEALLECYLRLNPPSHHATIALAFLSAWAATAASTTSFPGHAFHHVEPCVSMLR
ncbi:hypothetical protein KP509_18G010500 [Ceratopteris richardii]|uniref:Transcription repressor n=1 Tax=Ceratopteris richardii TaxID=49495 RepID=A0A8T2SRW9_CERRI|nr:hypothetical protein KP509_18G010500 [Ceratopteris richardii]